MIRRSSTCVIGIAGLVCLVAGCGDEPPVEQQSGNQQNDQDNDESHFEVYDPSDRAVDQDEAVEFVVENGATISAYFQIRSAEQPEPAWLDVSKAGESFVVHPHCMPPLCGEDKKPICEDLEPTVFELEAQETMTWRWDMRHYELDEAQECTEPVDETGQFEVDVEICWGTDVDWDAGQIREPDCAGGQDLNAFGGAEITITVS